MSTENTKAQANLPEYQSFVVDELVGILGVRRSDVIARIIGDWFEDRSEYLDDLGLSVRHWKDGSARRKSIAPVADIDDRKTAKSEQK